MDNADQKALNNYFTKSINGDNFDVNIELKDEDDDKQSIKDGKEIIKDESNDETNSETKKSDEDDKEEIKISFTKDVLPFVIPFACLLTLNDNNNDFINMLDTIGKNKELLEIFDEQSYIWWNNKGILELIKKLTEKYVEKNSNTFNIGIIMKTTLKSLIDKPKELLEFIAERLKPKETEKKKFGEVFTPMKLVFEMIDKLYEYYKKNNNGKSIFSNKNLKWFDPCVGMGNFMIAVYLRLMEGLKTVIKDDIDRKKHILENMLYMSELNKKNVLICKEIFDINNEYKLNIYNGDSLKLDTKKEWNIENFDVIVGNPPYQQKVGPKKTETIWNKFVIKSFDILKNNGFLTFIHPSGWRNIDGKFKNIQNEILKRNLQYLEIHNEKDGLKTFSSETRYDWYIIKNEKINMTNTTIKFQDGKINIINVNELEFIPNGEFEKIFSLIAKDNEEKCNVIYSRSEYGTDKKNMQRHTDETYKYPCVYTVNSLCELTYYYSSEKKGHFDIPKFIWSNGRISSIGSYIDNSGKYGLTQFAYAIIDKPVNLNKIKKIFDDKQFRNLMELCAVGQLTINYKVISIFKKDFYKHFINDETKINDINLKSSKYETKIEFELEDELEDEKSKNKDTIIEVTKKEFTDKKPKKKLKSIKKIIPSNNNHDSSNDSEIVISDSEKPTKKPKPVKK